MSKVMSRKEIKESGLVIVGEWGGSYSTGFIVAKPEDRVAVQAAYDAIEEGDLSAEVLSEVKAAGGFFVEEK